MKVKELQEILINMLNNNEITPETDIGIYLSIIKGSAYADYVYELNYERDSDCLYFENKE